MSGSFFPLCNNVTYDKTQFIPYIAELTIKLLWTLGKVFLNLISLPASVTQNWFCGNHMSGRIYNHDGLYRHNHELIIRCIISLLFRRSPGLALHSVITLWAVRVMLQSPVCHTGCRWCGDKHATLQAVLAEPGGGGATWNGKAEWKSQQTQANRTMWTDRLRSVSED